MSCQKGNLWLIIKKVIAMTWNYNIHSKLHKSVSHHLCLQDQLDLEGQEHSTAFPPIKNI